MADDASPSDDGFNCAAQVESSIRALISIRLACAWTDCRRNSAGASPGTSHPDLRLSISSPTAPGDPHGQPERSRMIGATVRVLQPTELSSPRPWMPAVAIAESQQRRPRVPAEAPARPHQHSARAHTFAPSLNANGSWRAHTLTDGPCRRARRPPRRKLRARCETRD